MTKLSAFSLALAALALCGVTLNRTYADTFRNTDAIATRHTIATSAGYDIPAGAFGFVTVSRPREVTLLQLRGLAGRGHAVLRTDEPGQCLRLALRFVAGDFGGDGIKGQLAEPIHFVLKSREVARALAKGRDVISDDYVVSSQPRADTDIVIQTGLDESFGFVLNPGRNILGDIFGARADRLPCQNL